MKSILLYGAFTDGPGFHHDSKAEIPSTGSATPTVFSLRANVTTAWDALCYLYICSFFKPWETDTLVRTIAGKAYSNNYQGKWLIVQQILEEQINNPQDFIKVFLQHHSPDDFYGNLVYRSQKLFKILNYKDITKQLYRHRIKKYTGWCRGPVDKGSRLLAHEKPVDPPEKPERIDRRHLVKHPLLETENQIFSELGTWPETTSGKEENKCYLTNPRLF